MANSVAIHQIKRRTVLEAHRVEILDRIIEGKKIYEIAAEFGVSIKAIDGFKRRYATVIAQMVGEVENSLMDYAIANKVNRVAAQDRRWQLLEAVRQARAQGGTGEETGLVVKQFRKIGHGEDAETVIEYKIDEGLLSAMARAERAAAEELGQIPKVGDKDAPSTTNNVLVLGDGAQLDLSSRASIMAFARKLMSTQPKPQYGMPYELRDDEIARRELAKKAAARGEVIDG